MQLSDFNMNQGHFLPAYYIHECLKRAWPCDGGGAREIKKTNKQRENWTEEKAETKKTDEAGRKSESEGT